MTVLLATPLGPRLYGLSHAESDHDIFVVRGWEKGRSKQSIANGIDMTIVHYDKFMRLCEKGVPQYLEAMFSPLATIDRIPFIRQTYHVGLTNVNDTYLRTIKSFWEEGVEQDNFKLRRHAARLTLNLRSMHECGRFDPVLNVQQQAWCLLHAKRRTLPPAL